ncbi:hypothetical protein C5F64_15630 [Photobacterium damselae subsp. damselae]|uniref:hypothetical protein n=1 Tax=Photobacterium damselae TaxID=38293 RepID=UPI000D04CA85|nr:hypothetical protein [Photobacterium damselae]PSB82677.1 hypothetical protein C5F64_15630 [Photobacterium damselae subsp. damselae]
MDRAISVIKIIKMLLGIPSDLPKARKFEIQPKMDTPNVVRMDIKSFRRSKAVREQVIEASKAV